MGVGVHWDVDLPEWLQWLAPVVVGDKFPRGDVPGLRALGEVWDGVRRGLASLEREFGPSVRGVLDSVGGD
ncbi:hypothetical protein PV350_44970, partial [Streptomyces sp. PA03-6a]|nr:hypothetical protein [Streptomyces sp. PA03-6a]